jgi:glycosyltransferase involved in cell wall biosynthesis
MRIAMVSEHASPLATLGGVDAGGQNVHVAALAEELAHRGHEVTVFTRRDAPGLADRVEAPGGYAVEHVAAGPPTEVPKDDLWPFMGDFAEDLAARLRRRPADVVHTHFWMSGWAGLRAARMLDDPPPVVHTFHALGVVKQRHQGAADTSPAVRQTVERQLGLEAARVVATATDEVRELAHLGVPRDRCAVVPCGVDLDLFRPGAPLRPRPPDGAPYRLLALGRLVERKGVDDVIAALRRLPDTELVVAGGPASEALGMDPVAQGLSDRAREWGVADRVHFHGRVERDRVPALIEDSDVVVCTPWYEPFGIVPLEAMACARPVVGSAVGGLLDTVVPGRTGELVPPRAPGMLAQALRSLLDDPDRRRAYGEAGVKRVKEHFGWPTVAQQTEAVYADVAAHRGQEALR